VFVHKKDERLHPRTWALTITNELGRLKKLKRLRTGMSKQVDKSIDHYLKDTWKSSYIVKTFSGKLQHLRSC